MLWKKLLKWGAIAWAVWYIITDPTGAAHLTTSAFGGLGYAGEQLGTFVSALSSNWKST